MKATIEIEFRTKKHMETPKVMPVSGGRLAFAKAVDIPFFPRKGDTLFLQQTPQETLLDPVIVENAIWTEGEGVTVYCEPVVVEDDEELRFNINDLILHSDWLQNWPSSERSKQKNLKAGRSIPPNWKEDEV